MSEKKFKVQKMSGPIMFWALKNLSQKELCYQTKFGVQANFGSKKILGSEKFWVPKMIGLEKNLP